jgi:hypothetical protein
VKLATYGQAKSEMVVSLVLKLCQEIESVHAAIFHLIV